MKKRLTIPDAETIRRGTVAWFRGRVDLAPVMAVAEKKTVPIRWHSPIYLLGGAALFLFGLQLATGALLMLYYQPTEAAAYESVGRIMNDVPYGWLIRSVHTWGANLFIATVALHFLTVLFTRAYRKPREMTWLSGFAMLGLALAFGFSGYLLPWNELSYYATLVGTQMPGTVPGVGEFLVHFLRGGDQVSGDTITRFFAAHVMLLPLTLGLFLAVHLALIQFQGMSLPVGMKPGRVRDHQPFYTEFIFHDACLWLVLLGVIVTLAVLLPAHVGVKADPLKPAPEHIKPEWYFLFMFQTLKALPNHVGPIEGEVLGVSLFAALGLFFLLVPFLDRPAAREKHSPVLTAVFVLVCLYAAAFQVRAILTPSVEHPPEELAAETYSLTGGLVWLALLWTVVAFLVFYLAQLRRLNTRVRKLYHGPG